MRAGATLAGTAALALGGLLAACGGGGSAGPVQTLTQPPSAAKVAHQLGAAGFTDCGSAPGGGVTDSGTAYLGGKRIGIDTFPGAGVRDQWKKTAASFGVSPRWQGPAWVAYNATSQTAHGCQ